MLLTSPPTRSTARSVSSGAALGFVAEGCAGSYRTDPNIRLLPISDNEFHRRVMVHFKPIKQLSEAGQQFEAFMKERLGLTGNAADF